MDIPSDVDTESDRVFFIKAVAQFMVTLTFDVHPQFGIIGYNHLYQSFPLLVMY